MTLIAWLLSAKTIAGATIVLGFYTITKIVDLILVKLGRRKIIAPAKKAISWRIRSIWTHVEPLEASFEFTFTPRDSIQMKELQCRLSDVFEQVEKKSGNRISIEKFGWSEMAGNYRASHPESKDDFAISVNPMWDPSDRTENPAAKPPDRRISSVHFTVDFSFAFSNLENELSNVGTFVSILRREIERELSGNNSTPKIAIKSLENNLTLDDWIHSEGFEVSLHLTGSNEEDMEKTQIEFLSDHIEVYPPYFEVDGELMRYIKLLVLNYYLLGDSTESKDDTKLSIQS